MLTVLPQYLSAIGATIRRDALIFASYRFRFVTQVLGTLFTLTMFYYISRLVRADAVGLRNHYFAFAVVGIVIMAVLTSAINTSQLIRVELMQGNFERIMISPLGPLGGVTAVAVFPILYATALAGVTLALGSAIFGIPVRLPGIPLSLVVAALGATAFACAGVLFVALLLAFKSSFGTTAVVAGLSLLGGAYFPVRLFPGWIRWISDVQPFTPTVDLLRHLLIGTPSLQAPWFELVRLTAFTVVLVPVSMSVLWLAVRSSRRRGTILEF